MHELIVSPFLGTHLVLRPGQPNAIRISRDKYAQLQSTGRDELCPNCGRPGDVPRRPRTSAVGSDHDKRQS